MKKTKIQRRIENAFDAFFADENSSENALDLYRNEFNLRRESNDEYATRKNGTLETVLKQTLLFFPGTFVLYGVGMMFLPLFIDVFTARYRADLPFVGLILFCLLIAGTLMSWLGLGDIRNRKHFVIPTSIFSVGVLSMVIVGDFSIVLKSVGIWFVFRGDYLVYIFPLALIVPFLAKGWVDRISPNANR